MPIKYQYGQPPKCILNALFYKMKADYLRYIYECLAGDNGLLAGTDPILSQPLSFAEDLKKRNNNEISEEGHVDCDICNPMFE